MSVAAAVPIYGPYGALLCGMHVSPQPGGPCSDPPVVLETVIPYLTGSRAARGRPGEPRPASAAPEHANV